MQISSVFAVALAVIVASAIASLAWMVRSVERRTDAVEGEIRSVLSPYAGRHGRPSDEV